jgi:ribosomal protein S18 acetylase RimI-like enzyme
MDDFERAFALMDGIDERIAERVDPTPHGRLIVSTRLFHVHDENFLRVADPGDASARELAAEADAAQSRYPQVRHRRVNLRGAEPSARLEPGFVALGWAPQRFVLMAQRKESGRKPDAPVHEVEEPGLRAAWAEGSRSFLPNEEVVRQVVDHHTAIGRVIPTRYFAVAAEGRVGAYCELYSWDGVGQVENVVTLPPFRNRGFARALVMRATAESRAENDLTFLVADADDWPYRLYEKLGFEIVGRYSRFLNDPRR